MAVTDIKDNVRLKLELDVGLDGNRQVIKSKTLSKVKTDVLSDDLFAVAESLAGLQSLPLYKVKRLEEIELVDEEL
ncbi:DUF1659 domain-containing protein [Schnuerera sp. xch1]|uniref:DUF1659 domain-containing protein n=1 Tax=Schnuerera sp. xch1 TaxID=2874283 RepID=UPI001CBD1BDC|nr:DUF1659 domain-containing protein [Schnuerera sp. xch1]MBZ2174812.1 DUF1659 domain-containing protein [Schnuerera sp. xch1]